MRDMDGYRDLAERSAGKAVARTHLPGMKNVHATTRYLAVFKSDGKSSLDG